MKKMFIALLALAVFAASLPNAFACGLHGKAKNQVEDTEKE